MLAVHGPANHRHIKLDISLGKIFIVSLVTTLLVQWLGLGTGATLLGLAKHVLS